MMQDAVLSPRGLRYSDPFEGVRLSGLGMGAMRLPQVEPGFAGAIDEPRAMAIIERCMDLGINYYDTAYGHHGGASESLLARALSRYPRESYYLADKFNVQANPDFRAQFEEQLGRLKTDYVDFYMLHGVTDALMDDYLNQGAPEYFDAQKEKGRIGRFGFSFHGSTQALRDLLDRRAWDFVQIQLNYYD